MTDKRRTLERHTRVRIKLMEDASERLQAFCSITFDNAFVIRDLKIIDGANGPFVAMPSRKLTAHCPHCGCKIVGHGVESQGEVFCCAHCAEHSGVTGLRDRV